MHTMAQVRSYYASNIISNSHPFHSKWIEPPPHPPSPPHTPIPHPHPPTHPPTHPPSIPPPLSPHPFLRYSNFNILPWKSKVKVMCEVKVESHNMGSTFYRLTSLLFHVNRPTHCWDTTFSKFDLENPRSRSWFRCKLKVTKWVRVSIYQVP